MKPTRRRLMFGAAGLATCPSAALAWPDRPVRIVVGFQAGGGSDLIARVVAERLRPELGGATVIVENKPGAAGMLAAEAVIGAHDSHSLLMLSDSFLTSSLTNKRVRYQPLRDFKPIGLICEGPLMVLAAERAPFRDFASFVAYVRANPGKMNYVTAGLGGQQHLTAEYLSAALKLEMTHVPMRGGSQATQDLLAGQVEAGILGMGPTLPHIRSGKMVPLAVTAPARYPALPDVPTLVELGVEGFSVMQWFGIAAAADAPQPVIDQMAKAMAKALDDDATRRRVDEIGYTVRWLGPADYAEKVRTEDARWRKLIAERGIKID